jgi:hypothetical protein
VGYGGIWWDMVGYGGIWWDIVGYGGCSSLAIGLTDLARGSLRSHRQFIS